MRTTSLFSIAPLTLSLVLAACSDSKSSSPPDPDGGDPGTGGKAGSGGATGNGGAPSTGGKAGTGGSPGTGGKAGNGGTNGSGGTTNDPDGGGWDTRPITSRESRDTHTCKVERARTAHAPRNWGSSGHDLVATSGGDAFLARVESTGTDPFNQGPSKFVVGKLGVDGVFGATVEPSTASTDTIAAPALAPNGDGFALVWVEGASLRFAAFDAGGAVTVPSKALPSGPVDVLSDPHLVRAGSNFGVAYTSASAEGQDADVRFLLLDADGDAVGASKVVKALGSTGYAPVTNAVADGDGYAIVFRDVEAQRGHVYFTARDAAGAERVAPRRISIIDEEKVSSGVGSGFDRSSIGLLKSGSGFLASWTETRQGEDFSGGSSTIVRVAKLANDGALEHDPVAVRDVEVDIDEVEPSLHAMGAAVALLWARGSHIYICAGCMPDHRVDLLLLDPDTLDPVSSLVTLPKRTEPGGGLMARDTAILGQNVLMAFDQQYHVSADPASGVFSCVSR